MQAWSAMGDCMISHLNPDVSAAHLLRYCGRGSGAEKGVEYQIARITPDMDYSLEQSFRLRRGKCASIFKKGIHFPFRLTGMTNFVMR